MCGICGYIITKKSHAEEAKEYIAPLLVASQERGEDATGILYGTRSKDGRGMVCYLKENVPARAFVLQDNFKNFLKEAPSPMVMIGHARAKTQGDAKNNANNHPIVTKNGLGVVHNGIINNDYWLFKDHEKDFARDGEVDSEIIPKLTEYLKLKDNLTFIEAIKKMAKEIRGSMACAMVSASEPNSLYLWASTSPIWLSFQVSTGTIFFASTKEILEKVLFKNHNFFRIFTQPENLTDFIFLEIHDDTGYKITQKAPSIFSLVRPEWTGYNNNWGGQSYTAPGASTGTDDTATKSEKKIYLKGGKKNKSTKVRQDSNLFDGNQIAIGGLDKLPGKTNGIKKNRALITKADPYEAIIRPSRFDDASLNARYEVLRDKLDLNELTIEEKNEMRRIDDTLIARIEKEEQERDIIDAREYLE